jgi:hypothetical protein
VAILAAAAAAALLKHVCVAVLNLLDWGPSNYLAAALNNSVYLYETGDGPIELTAITNGYYSAVKWDYKGENLILGNNSSLIQVRIILKPMNYRKVLEFALFQLREMVICVNTYARGLKIALIFMLIYKEHTY